MFSASTKNLLLNLLPSQADKMYSSQMSNASSEKEREVSCEKKVLGKKTGNDCTSKNNMKIKIQQNKEKMMMIREKILNKLKASKSTTLSTESELHQDKLSPKGKKKVTIQAAIQGQQPPLLDIKASVPVENNPKTTRDCVITLNDNSGQYKFKIIRYINSGISGKVYLAQDISNGSVVCIKVIPRGRVDKSTEQQLFRQIKIQSFLNHPNIVKLYHFFVDNQNIYLMLEACLGNDLYKKIKEEKDGQKEKQVKKIIKQVCQATDYMHKNDVIHRDLKPENILMHENVAKICDFGWAIHSPILRDTLCGTPLYSSPEMIKKEPYDSKIDIWSIGVLTYELLYGTIPFQIRQLQDLDKIIEQQIYFCINSEVSKQAKDFIRACTNKSPALRLNIRQALQHDFLKNMQKNRLSMC